MNYDYLYRKYALFSRVCSVVHSVSARRQVQGS